MKNLNVKGRDVLLDDADYEMVKGLNLVIIRYRDQEAIGFRYMGTTVYLQRFLLQNPDHKIGFIDGNRFNLQRENLKVLPSKNGRKYRQTEHGKTVLSTWRKQDHVKDYYNKYYSYKRKEVNYRFSYTRNKAKQDEIEFSLTLEQYTELLSKPCFYSGESLFGESGRGLDRIDNSKGYTIDNVLPARGWCNKMRNNFLTVEETKVAVEAVLKFRNSK